MSQEYCPIDPRDHLHGFNPWRTFDPISNLGPATIDNRTVTHYQWKDVILKVCADPLAATPRAPPDSRARAGLVSESESESELDARLRAQVITMETTDMYVDTSADLAVPVQQSQALTPMGQQARIPICMRRPATSRQGP